MDCSPVTFTGWNALPSHVSGSTSVIRVYGGSEGLIAIMNTMSQRTLIG